MAFVVSTSDDLFHNQPGRRDVDFASRRAEEAAKRRYEAAAWLRNMVGFIGGKDLPENLSEEEFMHGLRNGLVLCNVMNKILPGAVPKVVSSGGNSALPEETALSAYQYFENIRNFRVAAGEIGLPLFEASDLEKGGNSTRVVDCVLSLKSYGEWKQTGGTGSWKFSENVKPTKFFVMRNSEPFASSQKESSENQNTEAISPHDSIEMNMHFSVDMLVHKFLAEKPKEVAIKKAVKDLTDNKKIPSKRKVLAELASVPSDTEMESGDENLISNKDDCVGGRVTKEEAKIKLENQKLICQQQEKGIQELRYALRGAKADIQFMQMKYSEDLSCLGKRIQELAHAASGYHRVLEENRYLYNQVQDLKGNIRVYCRVRPFLPGQSSGLSSIGEIEDGNITINAPLKYGKEGHKSFSFNKVFGTSATQDEIFKDTQPLIRSVLDGYNVCIFAYGQTGSGKTYTMVGPKEITQQNQGVNYRALNDLFCLAEQRKKIFSYNISVQMIEIYNEQVRDLLCCDGLSRKLEIHNSSQNGVNVPEAMLVPVASTSDIIELMDIGQRNRAVGSTALNDRSSRSHSCLTVHVQGREVDSGTVLRGCMHLVDLAGSERVDKSEVTGERLKEAQHINRSLSALGDVIASLANKNSHVPYRNSKLTQLLQDALGGQAKTLMFVHISPELDAIGETISTLKFAERVSMVELGAAQVNKERTEMKELKEEVARLKDALARKNGQAEQHFASPKYSNRSHGRSARSGQGKTEASSNSSTRRSRLSIDPQELLSGNDSSPWLDNKSTDKETSSEECSDDLMNKQQSSDCGGASTREDWQKKTLDLPEFFYQRYQPGKTVLTDHQSKIVNMSGDYIQMLDVQSAIADDLDELEIATSISSEPDMSLRCNPSDTTVASGSGSKLRCNPSDTTVASGSGSKLKLPQPRPAKITDTRSCKTPVRASGPGPSPSRKLPDGSSRTPNSRYTRQLSSVDRLRQSSNGKKAIGK